MRGPYNLNSYDMICQLTIYKYFVLIKMLPFLWLFFIDF